jgi:phospholipid/cholesterol/gamma-HCH transport system substrate-binding protein
MRREIGILRALANVVLVAAVLGLAAFGVSKVAKRHWKTQSMFRARAEFSHVAGIRVGDRIRIQGIEAGLVESIEPPSMPGRPVALTLRLDERLRPLVRSDATARIVSEGVVGSKLVEIVPGTANAPALEDGASLKTERPIEVADLLREAQASLQRLDRMTTRAEQGLSEINTIASKVRRGEGTLGRLVQNEDLYRDLLDLVYRGRKAFYELDENLAALKRTWPLKNYFENRAFYDIDRLLYRPGTEHTTQVIRDSDLFEPGSALLSLGGRRRLDAVATWFQAKPRPHSTEVVIAAFTDSASQGEDIARILTQDQADTVRKYLVEHYSINSAGWFNSRKIAAVGFGTQTPRMDPGGGPNLPARRIEIVLFTPQT